MKCQICGKTSIIQGTRKKLRGHYNPTGKRWARANIQWLTMPKELSGLSKTKRVHSCTRCLRSFAKNPKKTLARAVDKDVRK